IPALCQTTEKLLCLDCTLGQRCLEPSLVSCNEGERCATIKGFSDYKVHEYIYAGAASRRQNAISWTGLSTQMPPTGSKSPVVIAISAMGVTPGHPRLLPHSSSCWLQPQL
ncbi:hypothetical protein E2320_014603, partial [Naja naja]